MSHARAAVAGVLSAGLVIMLAAPDDLRSPERALAAFVALLAIIGLLLGVDAVDAWRRRKGS